VTDRFAAVSWSEFQDWDLWMIAATLGLDRVESTEEDQELLTRYLEATTRPPSPDRKG